MGLNDTPNANRTHIAFFGMRNAGKSSLLNAVTGQDIAVVSAVKGTTTDPVSKAMELLPLGPVLMIDTPGFDDAGDVGELRIRKTKQVLDKTDVAILIVDAAAGLSDADREMLKLFAERELPHMVVYNKCDLMAAKPLADEGCAYVSAVTREGIERLKERIAALAKRGEKEKRIIADIINPGDVVVLVTPIDGSAPKGRMILPQVQTMRDVLDSNAICMLTQTDTLERTLDSLKTPPQLVITDSQAFGRVKQIVPQSIPLTSFSIIFARYKGILETAVKGAAHIEALEPGDTLLISEGCSHHRQCEDIGTVKLPAWIREYTGKELNFEFTSGGSFPDDIGRYKLIVHCGGCMLNEKAMQYRQRRAEEEGIPFTNYGTLIAYMNGILARSLAPFPKLLAYLKPHNG